MATIKLSADQRIARLEARIARIEALVERQSNDLQIQFKRTAQVQAELDEMRTGNANVTEWVRNHSPKGSTKRSE